MKSKKRSFRSQSLIWGEGGFRVLNHGGQLLQFCGDFFTPSHTNTVNREPIISSDLNTEISQEK